ncbi:MAG: hypothetical protein K2X91_13960 [Thermoleophilia bacterium]|nr:hypothetical protein [Thermoleophilia bacterium]
MTLTTALEDDALVVDAASLAAGIHAGLGDPLTPDERLRAELLLQLPAADGTDYDYDPEALAAWIVDQVALARRTAVLEAVGDVEALELSQAAIVELSAAHATFVELAGQAQRLEQVRAIVRRGMTLSQSYDLANTLEAEVGALRGRLTGILGKYPELQQLMSDDVVARSAELQRADGSPIV